MRDERGSWYLLTGLIIGIILGLLYAWVLRPVEYVDTSPASLRADFKDQYRSLIASAYMSNHDLVRARARLELLQDADLYRALAEQAQRSLAQGNSMEDARALGLLAIDLGQGSSSQSIAITQPRPNLSPAATTALALSPTLVLTMTRALTPTQTLQPTQTNTLVPTDLTLTPSSLPATLSPTYKPRGTPSATPTLRPSSTTLPTNTPSVTLGGPFKLASREKICSQKLSKPLFQIEAIDTQGQAVPGVLVIVTWDGGEERFYTGLIPEKGPGFADFTATSGVIYSLYLGEVGAPVLGLTAAECQIPGSEPFWGAWLLTFQQH